jgi:hypothetical protein
MTFDEVKAAIGAVENELSKRIFVIAHTFSRDGRDLQVALTGRLRRSAKKGKVWNTRTFASAFKNASYGYDDSRAISAGGSDGIFRLTRDHKPANEMMRKMFDRYLDKPDGGAADVAAELGVALGDLLPGRLVSHHLRLPGLLHRGEEADTLVPVDYDVTKS